MDTIKTNLLVPTLDGPPVALPLAEVRNGILCNLAPNVSARLWVYRLAQWAHKSGFHVEVLSVGQSMLNFRDTPAIKHSYTPEQARHTLDTYRHFLTIPRTVPELPTLILVCDPNSILSDPVCARACELILDKGKKRKVYVMGLGDFTSNQALETLATSNPKTLTLNIGTSGLYIHRLHPQKKVALKVA